MNCLKCNGELGEAIERDIPHGMEGPPAWKRYCLSCEALHLSPYKDRHFWLIDIDYGVKK